MPKPQIVTNIKAMGSHSLSSLININLAWSKMTRWHPNFIFQIEQNIYDKRSLLKCEFWTISAKMSYIYNSFRLPVTWSINSAGPDGVKGGISMYSRVNDKLSNILPGPTPRTVRDPGAICVRPASWMVWAGKPRLRAIACNSNLRKRVLRFYYTTLSPSLLPDLQLVLAITFQGHLGLSRCLPSSQQLDQPYSETSRPLQGGLHLHTYHRIHLLGCFITCQCRMSALMHSALVKMYFSKWNLVIKCTWAAILPLVIPRSERTTNVYHE